MFFIQFPILIRILDLISVPNDSRDSFILLKFNTLSSWREIVSVHSSQWFNSLNWILLNDADDFLQFPILILNLDLISVPNHSKGSYILIKFNTFSSWREIVSVHSSQWSNSLNWIQLNDADGFLQFAILIRILGRTSVPKHTRDSFTLIKFNTLTSWREIVSVHSSQWFNSLNWIQLNDADVFHSISDIDSESRPHFRPESFQRFIYFNKIQHFLFMEGDCQSPFELVV